MCEKRVCCFENQLLKVKKKQSVRKNTPKNQKELNGIGIIHIDVVVLLIFTPSFFNYSPFYFILFHFIFLPSTFSGTHVRTLHTGSYASDVEAEDL